MGKVLVSLTLLARSISLYNIEREKRKDFEVEDHTERYKISF